MTPHDHYIRIMTQDGAFRAAACVATVAVREACRRHETLPAASVALGRAMVGGALMGSMLKEDQRLGLRFEGNGPLRKVMVEVDAYGGVAGAVGNPTADLRTPEGAPDVARSLGLAGFLTVTKDLGLKAPYRGMVQLVSSQIGEDLAAYLTESEQVPSAVGLGVYLEEDGSVASAGGFLVQALPPGDERRIDLLMERIGQLPPLSPAIRDGLSPQGLLARIFPDDPLTILEKRQLRFSCSCSRKRTEQALVSLGRAELAAMAERGEITTVTCEFCRQPYDFDPDTLRALAEALS
jgi:molecular chaperone Hsp33